MKKKQLDKIYNENFKNEFIEALESEGRYAESYFNSVRLFFKKTYDAENYRSRDLYDFTFDDIKDMLKDFKSGTEITLRKYVSILKLYLVFAKQIRKKGIVGMASLYLLEDLDYSQFISRNYAKDKVVTKDELLDVIIPQIDNPRDKAIFALVFYGVMGKNYETLRNLKKGDIDFDKMQIRIDDNIITIDDEDVMDILRVTANEEVYRRVQSSGKKDQGLEFHKRYRYVELANNDYLLRPAKTKNNTGQLSPIAIKAIIYRMTREMEKEYINGGVLFKSGILYKMCQEGFEKEDKSIAKRWVTANYGSVEFEYSIWQPYVTYYI